MKTQSITIRIDEHLKNELSDVCQRTQQPRLSEIVRLLLQSSIDRWNSLGEEELKEELRRINRDSWDRFYGR